LTPASKNNFNQQPSTSKLKGCDNHDEMTPLKQSGSRAQAVKGIHSTNSPAKELDRDPDRPSGAINSSIIIEEIDINGMV
jgi:hypothetical protein